MIKSRPILAWAFYDWANSAFAVVVLAGFYPLFFRDYWAAGEPSRQITFWLGLANSIASLLIVLLAPTLGAIADQGSLKKRLLVISSLSGIGMTAALFWIAQGQWGYAIALFILANVGWMGANVFYDSLLIDVAEAKDYDRVSALGYGLGYLGGGLLFALCVAMTLKPAWFFLQSAQQAVSLSFLLVALWWLAFSLPLWLLVREQRRHEPKPFLAAAREGFRQLAATFHHIRQLRGVLTFLLAYWLYIDGVDTVIRMAVDFGKARGIGTGSLITALLMTQFIGFPSAIAFGWLGEKIGARRGILIAIGVYIGITLWAANLHTASAFYVLAGIVGLVQGGLQSLSRSLYASLIPSDKAAEFFGFYNMLGKAAAIIGPLLVGGVGLATGSESWGLLSLLILFISGGLLLLIAPARKNRDPK
ncbi:MAG TPA: MFS transporter [Gammaproteobacteria bacterium]|nr:MFS transporter [Gammaproteobacteria bacterium]